MRGVRGDSACTQSLVPLGDTSLADQKDSEHLPRILECRQTGRTMVISADEKCPPLVLLNEMGVAENVCLSEKQRAAFTCQQGPVDALRLKNQSGADMCPTAIHMVRPSIPRFFSHITSYSGVDTDALGFCSPLQSTPL